MTTFISENIVSEGGLTATTLNSTTVSGNSISATTFFGGGTNITGVIATPSSPDKSIQFNNGGSFSGSSNLLYSGATILFTGTSRFDGIFHVINSSSAKLKIQWFGTQTAGTAPGIIWTNMPLLPTTWLHQTSGTLTGDATFIVDLTEYKEFRFFFSKQVAGAAPSNLVIQYSFDNSTWQTTPLVTLAVGTGTGVRDSNWTSIPEVARTFIYIRLVGTGGNGTADPRFSPPIILFR
jgi:hypothetical protein